MLSKDDSPIPQIVRNVLAVAKTRPEMPHDAATRHTAFSVKIAGAFDARCSSEPFYGYVVPYDGSALVEPKTYKFKARWTFEAAQDAKAATGIDIEQELIAALTGEMIEEVRILAGDQIIFPCLVELSGIMIDPQTFEPVARFHMIYYSSPSKMIPPIDMAAAPAVIV